MKTGNVIWWLNIAVPANWLARQRNKQSNIKSHITRQIKLTFHIAFYWMDVVYEIDLVSVECLWLEVAGRQKFGGRSLFTALTLLHRRFWYLNNSFSKDCYYLHDLLMRGGNSRVRKVFRFRKHLTSLQDSKTLLIKDCRMAAFTELLIESESIGHLPSSYRQVV